MDRASVVAGIVARVRQEAPNLGQQECVAAAIAAALPHDASEVLGFCCSGGKQTATAVADAALRLSVTATEFDCIFGIGSSPLDPSATASVAQSSSMKQHTVKLEKAAAHTLAEAVPRQAWLSSTTRVAAYVATHLHGADERVSALLGGVVRSDNRRLEDLFADIEDGDADPMLLSSSCLALAASVCR